MLQAALVAAYMGYGSTVVHAGTVDDHSVGGFYVLATLAIASLLTNLAQTGVRRLAGRPAEPHPLGLLLGIWLAYLAGATLGGYLLDAVAVWCLAVPLGVLLLASLRRGRRPGAAPARRTTPVRRRGAALHPRGRQPP